MTSIGEVDAITTASGSRPSASISSVHSRLREAALRLASLSRPRSGASPPRARSPRMRAAHPVLAEGLGGSGTQRSSVSIIASA